MFGRISAASLIGRKMTPLEISRAKARFPGPFMSDQDFRNLLARTRKMRRGSARVAFSSLSLVVR